MSGEDLGKTAEGLVMIGSEDMPADTPIVKGCVPSRLKSMGSDAHEIACASPSDSSENCLSRTLLFPRPSAMLYCSYDFENGVDFDKLFEAYKTTGFQATNLGLAIEEVKKMVSEESIYHPSITREGGND